MKKNLIILCMFVVLTSILGWHHNYSVPSEASSSDTWDKVIYENGGYTDSGLITEDTDISNDKIIIMVLLEYKRNPIDMVPNLKANSTSINDYVYQAKYENDYKTYHTNKNKEIVENIKIGDYEERYISTLTPFIEYTYSLAQFSLNKNAILSTLNSNKDVKRIYVQQTSNNKMYKDCMLDGTGMAGADQDVYFRNYTGDGIKVGVLENGVIDTTHSNFTGVSVTIHNQAFYTETTSEHATSVASLIGGNNGIANEVSFLSSQIRGGICEEVDWLVNQGADVINMSFMANTRDGIYGADSAYVDYVARVYNQIFVTAAGNTDNTTNYYVDDPGLAYNVITVGAIDTNFYWRDFSCYQVASGPIKPTVMAKGYSIGIPNVDGYVHGTSYSAAFVTGLTAMILERYPALINNPMKYISLLTANATRTRSNYYYDEDNNFDEYMGAGEFSYINICNNYVDSLSFVNSTTATTSTIYNQTFILNAGETLQASIAWFAYTDEDDVSTLARTNYDIRLMYNNITYSMGCTSYNNVEMVSFTATKNNSECAIIILQHTTQAMQTETIHFSYNIY